MTVVLLLLILGAYLLGSVPSAYLVAKWSRGIDIRQYGSGNVGASNVSAVISRRWSLPVTVFDIGKGALAVWIAQLMGLGAAPQITAGIATVIGHNWPIFLRFQGGRGIFTTLGVITLLSWKLGLIAVVISYTLAPVRQLALGSALALVSLPLFSWFLSQPLDIEARIPVTLGFAALALIALSRRLLASRTALSASLPRLELLTNRLLFDRDIRDKKAWLSQIRPEISLRARPRRPEKEKR
ncbi:MAG: glycerol-3-phosphate acyltransferase [Chloroflexi bacterium]|nr:glycerol-3-phosphate acyltransferase [Chloroflexota bacterium]